MKILLDASAAKVEAYSKFYGTQMWQLRTPLTQYAAKPGLRYGLDNGCFKHFDRAVWERMVEEAEGSADCVFVALPDVVGDAQRTAELFEHFRPFTNGLPRCLVLQNGIDRVSIPWGDLAAVFIGGDDAFKFSRDALQAAKTAKMLGKWVHVGRVNTPGRVRNWLGLADSIDGSGISRFDHMLEEVLKQIDGSHPQQRLDDFEAVAPK